jgi:hypothetical protein
MTSAELTEWMAYERVYGPILVHERVDVGLAQLQWLMVRLWTKAKQKMTIRDFMPRWYQELTERIDRKPEAVQQQFEVLMRMAEKESPPGREGGAKPTRGDD